MTVTEDRADPTADGASHAEAQALFEEARRRRRRRYAWGSATILVLVGAVALPLLATVGSGHRVVATGAATAGGAGARHSVRTITFGGGFVPDQVVATSGKIWVVGSTESGEQCEIEEVDPTSLRLQTFSLPACGTYVALGDGQIFLADDVFTAFTDSEAFHIETFDTTTHEAVVKAPVVITTMGTGYAHMALAYGGGSLWLTPWNDHVLEISPASGAVVATISDTLPSGGGHPVLTAGPNGLWLAPGVGGPAVVDRLTSESRSPVTIFTGSRPGAVLWMSMVGDRVWAEVAKEGDEGQIGPLRLVAFDGSGRELLTAAADELGQSALAVSGDQLWAVTAGADCTGRQYLWRIDGRTGTAMTAATFSSPVVPCPTDFGGSQLAAVGSRVFVLGGSGSPVLFRVATTAGS